MEDDEEIVPPVSMAGPEDIPVLPVTWPADFDEFDSAHGENTGRGYVVGEPIAFFGRSDGVIRSIAASEPEWSNAHSDQQMRFGDDADMMTARVTHVAINPRRFAAIDFAAMEARVIAAMGSFVELRTRGAVIIHDSIVMPNLEGMFVNGDYVTYYGAPAYQAEEIEPYLHAPCRRRNCPECLNIRLHNRRKAMDGKKAILETMQLKQEKRRLRGLKLAGKSRRALDLG